MSLFGMKVSAYLAQSKDLNGWNSKEYLYDSNICIPVASSAPSGAHYGTLYDGDSFGSLLQDLDSWSTDWLLESLFWYSVPTWLPSPGRIISDHTLDFGFNELIPYNDFSTCVFLVPENTTTVMVVSRESSNGGIVANSFDTTTGAMNYSWEFRLPYYAITAYTGSEAGSIYGRANVVLRVCFYYNNRIYNVPFRTQDTKFFKITRDRFSGDINYTELSWNGWGDFWSTAQTDYTPVIPTPSSDPYFPGGESDSGGGEGNFDGTSVDVDFATLPTLSAVDTGFITLYNPTLSQLQSLANYMWSGLFDVDTFKKLFADPMQAILGLSIVPGPVPGGASQNVKIGNIDSGVLMTKAATQYIDIDCGTLNVEEFWGAYLDYEPYTKAEIFLPFIGVHQIAIDDIMNKPVHIKYHIDLLSGGCACEIKCGGSVLYTFIGSCAVSIPVTGSDWTNLLNGVLSAASAIGTMVATGGAAAPAAASTIASAAVNSLKPSIEKSGSIAGAGGLLAGKVPVLILTRPRQALPGNQNKFTGYPAFITRSLGALSGYTEVHSIRLSGIDGTESEIDEIEELLKGGVIL